ncbi:hypothetical protein [Streptomyces sp. SDr-06]|uniref:hypothetical protein n=1 Tax=Streptomyces sp. SDr-06 TaxID=2267702 RepID=UPI001CB96971|nr:hypothetical protein [Streptomyces sp. SDr-06]
MRKYLFDQLTANLAPDPNVMTARLLVCYDEPGPDQPDDIVSVGKVHRTVSVNSMVGGGGAGWLEERYTVEIEIDVFRGNDDPQYVYQRASDLADATIAVVRSDPSLGGLVLTSRPQTAAHEVTWDDKHMGRHGTVAIEVECYTRI